MDLVEKNSVAVSQLIEKVARIYAKFEGFDPDSDHFYPKMMPLKNEYGEQIGESIQLVDSGKKKWEVYKERAQANIEIFKLLKMEIQ